MENLMKVCKECKVEKELNSFQKNKNCRNGVTGHCLECKRLSQNKFRESNREFVNNQAKVYAHKKNEGRAERVDLLKKGFKNCSKCLLLYPLNEYNNKRKVCFKCRTGHERGSIFGRDDRGCMVKTKTDEENKAKRKEWRENNKGKCLLVSRKSYKKRIDNPEIRKIINQQARQSYFRNRENRIAKGKIYSQSEKGKITKNKARRKWDENNVEKKLEIQKLCIEKLTDGVVRAYLKKRGGCPKELLYNPEIIEVKRLIIKTQRLCRTSQI